MSACVAAGQACPPSPSSVDEDILGEDHLWAPREQVQHLVLGPRQPHRLAAAPERPGAGVEQVGP